MQGNLRLHFGKARPSRVIFLGKLNDNFYP
jgi:hypothetical protein